MRQGSKKQRKPTVSQTAGELQWRAELGLRESLDDVDVNILRILQQDGRTTNADLARMVGLSAPSVLQRVRKMEELGIIRGYTCLLNAERLGYGFTIYVQISLSLHQEQPVERFLKAIRSIPQILECYHVGGEYDFLLKIVAEDMPTYQQLVMDKLSQIKGIGKIQSCFVMGTEKSSTRLPI